MSCGEFPRGKMHSTDGPILITICMQKKQIYTLHQSSSSDIIMRPFFFPASDGGCSLVGDTVLGGSSSTSEDIGGPAASGLLGGEELLGEILRCWGRGFGLGLGFVAEASTAGSSASSSPMTPMSLSSVSDLFSFSWSTVESGSPLRFFLPVPFPSFPSVSSWSQWPS